MKTLPNGLKVFNATPHTIRFWDPEWPEPVEVETDEIVSAEIAEYPFVEYAANLRGVDIEFVTPRFVSTAEGREIISRVYRENGPNTLIVGSIIAAQAYLGLVVGMTPAPGYERVPPAEKRMRPDKFTVYPG